MTKAPIIRWGADTPQARGPVVAGLDSGEHRNAIGVHAGAFSIYQALAVATGELSAHHRPDLTGTAAPAAFGPFPQWSEPGRIVTMDPWGHRVGQVFAAERAAGMDIRPSIAVTTGHLLMPEINAALSGGRLVADGQILGRTGDIRVTKIAIEPVWWLPGVAERLGLPEQVLRQALFTVTDGMYPALLSQPERKVFLPPIGGTSVYLFGDPTRLARPSTRITCRIHDECSGSDVFGSDLCTCRPYLAFGVEEAIRQAQQGGLGAVIYNRKEGRALGEVVKLLVYSARSQAAAGDRPADYFSRTEAVAGVSDMRFQSLSVDALHWLGLRRIDRWVSMSNLKSGALEDAGIRIVQQVEIPDDLVPQRANVEISAKRASGYFTTALAS